MRKLFLAIALFVISVSLSAQVSNAFSAHIGDSWVNGLLGAEYQISNYALSVGWIPGRFPYPYRKNINSLSAAFTVYEKNWNEDSFYISTAYASEGYPYAKYGKESNMLITGYNTASSIIVLLGHKSVIDKTGYFKFGFGLNASEQGDKFEFEIMLGLNIFKNKTNE